MWSAIKKVTLLVVAVFITQPLFVSKALIIVPPPALVHVAIGATSGAAGAIAAYPIDYVKSQLQTEVGRDKYKGGFEAAYDIVIANNGGPLALYRGVMVNVVGVAPEKTIKLSVNDFLRQTIRSYCSGTLPIVGEVIAGGIAGMTQVTVTNPLEVIKVRMQTSNMTLNEIKSQIHGLHDMYEGAEACIIRDMIFSATLFPLYAHVKVIIANYLMTTMMMIGDGGVDHRTASVVAGVGMIQFWSNLIAGSLAAAPAAFLATPADVIKTRMQQAKKREVEDVHAVVSRKQDDNERQTIHDEYTSLAGSTTVPLSKYNHDGDISDSSSNSNNPSFISVTSSIVSREGPMVLFSGWFERVVRSVPQFGVTLACFDVLTSMAIERGVMNS